MKLFTSLVLIILVTGAYGNDTASSVKFNTVRAMPGTKNWEGIRLAVMKRALVSMDSLIETGKAVAQDYFNRGVLKSALEDLSGAMMDYNKAIAMDNNNDALVNRSILLMSQRKYKEALTDVNKVIKLHPDNAIPYNNRGFLLQAQKKYEEAIKDYTKACQLDKEYINPFVNKIRCYLHLKKYKEAKAMCDELMIKYPDDPKMFVELSDFYVALRDLDAALDYLNQGVKASHNAPEMYLYRSKFKDDVINDDLGAIKDCDTAITLAPEKAEGYYGRCRPLFDLKQYDRIIKDCNTALSLDSTYYDAWVMRGDAYDLSGNTEQAKYNYENAIRMQPKKQDSYIQLAVLYSSRYDIKNAVATLERLLKVDSTNQKALSQIVSVKMENKDFKSAKKDLLTLLGLSPDDPELIYYLGTVEDSLGDKNNACRHMKLSDDLLIGLYSDKHVRSDAHIYLLAHCRDMIPAKKLKGEDIEDVAFTKEEAGDYQGAVEEFSKLIALFPDSSFYYRARGKDKRMMNKYEDAIVDYKKALSMYPGNSDVLISLGVAQQKLYRNEEAMESYQKAIEANPENEMAYHNIGFMLANDKKYAEAIPYFKKAVNLKSDYMNAILSLGQCYEETGDKVNACKTFKKAEALGNGSAISRRIFNCN